MVQWPEGFINDNYFHLFHQKLFGISMKVLY